MIDLEPDQELGDHRVRERAVVHVVSGSIDVTTAEGTTTCEPGTIVLLEPAERHVVRARTHVQLLLTLAPWPGTGHYPPGRDRDPHELPVNATESEGPG